MRLEFLTAVNIKIMIFWDTLKMEAAVSSCWYLYAKRHGVVTGLINTLPGNSSVNTVQHSTVDEAVFSMSSVPSRGGTVGICNLFLGTSLVNTFRAVGPCSESGDVINNRDGVFRVVCAECL
jgi:hypothetical protein